jgi:hypothetical protein
VGGDAPPLELMMVSLSRGIEGTLQLVRSKICTTSASTNSTNSTNTDL